MKFLFDYFPIILFFIAYKFYGDLPPELIGMANQLPLMNLDPNNSKDAIYFATATAILSAFLQNAVYWLKHRRFEKMHLISLGALTVLGGITIALKDPVFVMWKPTIVNFVLAAVFFASQYIGEKNLLERMMGHALAVPSAIWKRVNFMWVIFFIFSGLTNLYVAYNFSEDFWVNFKLFGMLGLTLIFVIAQALYLARYSEQSKNASESS